MNGVNTLSDHVLVSEVGSLTGLITKQISSGLKESMSVIRASSRSIVICLTLEIMGARSFPVIPCSELLRIIVLNSSCEITSE